MPCSISKDVRLNIGMKVSILYSNWKLEAVINRRKNKIISKYRKITQTVRVGCMEGICINKLCFLVFSLFVWETGLQAKKIYIRKSVTRNKQVMKEVLLENGGRVTKKYAKKGPTEIRIWWFYWYNLNSQVLFYIILSCSIVFLSGKESTVCQEFQNTLHEKKTKTV